MQVPRRKIHQTDWFKSSYSNNAHGCVEARLAGAAVQVRDSKRRSPSPTLTFDRTAWAAFVSELRH
ncbi:DUF397 domain-containing protein [Amycolatopsis cihanbeyliensis]|uniref:Uncharacterized protein DUF397 n=1 Tax=Amycolatopsis cihanbeyliensis TaxID=1128664 RepID=A0A542DRQ1_AMYCI|nr:DUF397 domain-containing protein [Amycolatopsis cihanbeyliensis]TQJ05783.1 uncharacterized protein DUF397 [Amycolatopsis cihanbeyliensis]